MATPSGMSPQTITPKFPQFEFTLDVPANWQQIPIPEEQTDFSDPVKFMPLSVLMASFAPILFTCAARPAIEGDLAAYLRHATEPDMVRALNLAELMIRDLQFPPRQ